MPLDDPGRTAYVLKMYPRFSETFIVNEILAHQAAGAALHIVSLRPPVDGRFHESLAEVTAPVSYLPHQPPRAGDLWRLLGASRDRFPRLSSVLGDLLASEVDDASQALELAALVQDQGITHLHAHFGSVATTVARLASRLTGVPYTFTAHAKDIFHESVDPADLRRKLVDAAACVTVSQFNVDHLHEVYGSAGRVVRVYNGLDLERFAYCDPTVREPRVAAVGRLVEKKGFSDLIEAARQQAAAGRPMQVDLVGTGPLREALEAQVRRAGLGGAVTFHGALPSAAVREVVGRASCLVAPCVVADDGNRDGLPTVVLEAMALGTPCVTTDVTGLPEVVLDEETGLLVPQHSPDRLAGAIDRLVTEDDLRVRLARRGRALMEAEFDAHRQSERLRELFTASAVPAAVA